VAQDELDTRSAGAAEIDHGVEARREPDAAKIDVAVLQVSVITRKISQLSVCDGARSNLW
jgi:hypothetical protein